MHSTISIYPLNVENFHILNNISLESFSFSSITRLYWVLYTGENFSLMLFHDKNIPMIWVNSLLDYTHKVKGNLGQFTKRTNLINYDFWPFRYHEHCKNGPQLVYIYFLSHLASTLLGVHGNIYSSSPLPSIWALLKVLLHHAPLTFLRGWPIYLCQEDSQVLYKLPL